MFDVMTANIMTSIYFENVHFFHTKLGLYICPILSPSIPHIAYTDSGSRHSTYFLSSHILPKSSCLCPYNIHPTNFIFLQPDI